MSAPVYDKLNQLNNEEIYPFCMPGHKRNPTFFPSNVYSYDYTEIDGTDILRNPEGIIKNAQIKLASASHSHYAYMCVNGSTGAIQGSILYAVKPMEKILVATNCHKSVFNAIILSGAVPVFISPEITEYGFAGCISAQLIKKAVKLHPDIKACIITSPTYEGIVSDIEEISKVLHDKNITLIVDEAHGAYFTYFDFLPVSSVEKGADIVIQSYHKTLPLPNQCAVVLACDKIDNKRLNLSLSLTETSSPSYIFMSMMDKLRDTLINNVTFSDNYREKLHCLRAKLSQNKIFELLHRKENFYDLDKGKIVIIINSEVSGKEISDILINEFKIQPEAYNLHHLIFMTSIGDCTDNYACFDKLAAALAALEKRYTFKKHKFVPCNTEEIYIPKMRMRDAFYSPKKCVPVNKAAGLICAENIYAYPPGIPILVAGSKITQSAVDFLIKLKNSGVNIIGSDLKTINTVNIHTK